ncbi:MAG TPA: nucleotidyl transferase AbiEii/AbiGii toxin family protein [Nitriliruptorales bacterium]
MKDGPPPSLRSLEDRLRNYCNEHGLVIGRMRRLLGVLVIGQLASIEEGGVIKGGSNLELRLGTLRTRASSDLDAVRRTSIEEFRETLEESLRTGWTGFTGAVRDRGVIPAPVADDYRPHRFEAKLSYLGRPYGTVTIEVAVEEADGLRGTELLMSADGVDLCLGLGLPEPGPIPALALEQQVAQKVHACTAPDQADWVNDRAHDLVDLQLAMAIFEGSLAPVRQACERLFSFRCRHPWPPTVAARAGWAERYAQEASGLDVLADLDDAVAWANDFIARLTAARS